MAKQRVLVDTCVIIEAFRIKCWKALCNHFDVETVECCVAECCTGDPLRPGRVDISHEELVAGLAQIHTVDATMLATLTLECHDLPALDDGELHMMAWLRAHPEDAVLTVISTADQAAVRATHTLDLLDRVWSLEEMAKTAHVGRKQLNGLHSHFQEDWLSSLRTKLRLGVL